MFFLEMRLLKLQTLKYCHYSVIQVLNLQNLFI